MEAVLELDFNLRNDEITLQDMFSLDERLREEALPPCPFLPCDYKDLASVGEIRRTLVVANIDESVSGQELVEFFGNAGEVKYVRFCKRKGDPLRYCLVEFSSLMSVVNGLKLNNHTFHGKVIKVYHSVEAIEKPSYMKDPESFMQCLLELKLHVEDSYREVKRAAKEVAEYEDYCNDSQPPSKSPLKNAETAIADIEEALSKVLSAQSLISVAISPVESELLNIIGESIGQNDPIPPSPESFLKFMNEKRGYFEKEDLASSRKKESSKSSKSRNLHRRHRTRSRSKERSSKYHNYSGASGKSLRRREERARSHDNRSRKHGRSSSLHCPIVLSSVGGEEDSQDSVAHKSKEDEFLCVGVDDETNEVGDCKTTAACEDSRNESETEKDDLKRKNLVSSSNEPASTHSPEKAKTSVDKDVKENSSRNLRHESPSREHRSQSERSRSKSYGGMRSSTLRDYYKSPNLSSKKRSPPYSDKERKARLRRKGSRSPSLDHYHRHHHHGHRSSWSWHSGSSDHFSRSFSHRERWRRGELRDARHSNCRAPKGHRKSPRHHHRSSSSRRNSKEGSHREKSPGGRSHGQSEFAVVKVYPESYEEYLEESDVEVGGEERLPSSDTDDRSKTETASGGSSQNYSGSCVECEV
ncbi:splicing regulatory glutamine/lysine-rich protein 1-like isoform X2 [Ischnura elegans]|uniref:splicing regulatory glutamine/lysine-rich protein 1-like isoform X2 n=1 Tax=Ischnura elegans TaxID=197161 RepID=UPI001ED86EBD|nr:splicing regulatory glutamine/lysine-rich protein 1-like isoform X2 [Ischnura elegans]